MAEAQIIRIGIFQMQLCVPKKFSDEEIIEFAESENPAGTQNGWTLVRDGDEILAGDSARVQCADIEDNVHVVVEV